MKKTALIYGSIAGLIIIVGWFLSSLVIGEVGENGIKDFGKGEVLGYASMLIALSTIFFGVRKYKKEQLGGKMSFAQGFKTGLLIGTVCSVIYVLGWLIYYPTYAPDFMDEYAAYQEYQWIEQGLTNDAIELKQTEFQDMMEMYESPIMMILFTLMEIFPIALVIALICAAILRTKKPKALA